MGENRGDWVGTSKRVQGHALKGEAMSVTSETSARMYHVPFGQAGCTCGARSGPMASQGRGKRWHREHKAEMLAQARGE